MEPLLKMILGTLQLMNRNLCHLAAKEPLERLEHPPAAGVAHKVVSFDAAMMIGEQERRLATLENFGLEARIATLERLLSDHGEALEVQDQALAALRASTDPWHRRRRAILTASPGPHKPRGATPGGDQTMTEPTAPTTLATLLAECRELDAKATPGLARVVYSNSDITVLSLRGGGEMLLQKPDAAFIARARTLLPMLVQVVEAVEHVLDEYQCQCPVFTTPDRKCLRCSITRALEEEIHAT